MEATALSVGKSVLDGALGYAKSALAEEVALQLGIQRDHEFVTDELEMMRSFMMVAHEERDDSKVVKTWVKQVRDTAYDVEDSLQDFAVRVKKPSRWNILRTCLEVRHVAKQMKELRAKVEDVSQRSLRYRLINGSGSKAAAAAEQSSIISAAIFGVNDARRAAKQDNQRVDLVQLICKEEEDPKVIAVCGTSGDIGQTSIIRAAYENPDVQRKFPVRAWVRVMHPFSPKIFIQSLVNQFHAAKGVEDLLETEKSIDHQDLAQEFNGYVKEKRCLIVLNDLSTIEEWDQVAKCFRNNKKGSRIVVSATQVEVASLCAGQKSEASELKQLSVDHTLYAFYDKGSQNGKDLAKSASSSDAATTSTNDYTMAPGEIMETQSKHVGEKTVVRKCLTRITTSASAFEESILIGREKEIAYINELISNKDSQQVQVISLWGMGGLGKTTLVNGVYQSQKLSSNFEKYVFVTIMRPFDPAEFLRSLAERLKESFSKEELLNKRGMKTPAVAGFKDLTNELATLLEMKSCLIVLDDLSSTLEWDLIIQSLPHQMEKTSRIIVTTREENIAKHCTGKNGKIHNLKVLDYEDALDLFNKKVFGKTTDFVGQNPELVEEAKLILKKCSGLPLAIVTIGGFLANRPKTPVEWRKLNENISAELEMNPELGMIRAVLEKSYDGLPYHLKSCFLYLSIFPEDQIICRRRLVRRWAAEGYSTDMHGKSANEIADSYFMELKNRSMILPSQQSVHSRKMIDSCKVHDLMREIAISKSMEENLVFRLEQGCNLNNTRGGIRHLAISSNWQGDQSKFESTMDLSRIRSLSVFAKWRPFFISERMRFLRVLDLEGTKDLVGHHLEHIGKLLHLKYLSLRGCHGIFYLPVSLSNLRQLQTLDIRDTCIIALPKAIIKLQKLRYIHAGQKSDEVPGGPTSSVEKCLWRCLAGLAVWALCFVPRHARNGVSRRDLCALGRGGFNLEDGFVSVIVPRGTRKLKDLHTLGTVNIRKGNAVLQDIKRLTGLRKLGVAGINKKNGPSFCSAVSTLSRLESLSVRSAGMPGLCGCLDGMSLPPKNLQSLKLYGNLETLPEWITKLQHLVKLNLMDTRLSEYDAAMELLGNLPKLDILSLSWEAFQGEKLHFQCQQTEITFENLRVLKLTIGESTKSAKFEKGAMPKLEQLSLQCMESEIVFSGLEFLPSINEVQLTLSLEADLHRLIKGIDSRSWDKKFEEAKQEVRRKAGELKKKIRDQLAGNPRQPILMVD